MELNVTDRKSIAHNEFISDAFTLRDDHDETVMLKKVTLRFINAILDFNPDATEQLDLGGKHVSNVENLGDQVRKKSGSLIREMIEIFTGIENKFKDTSWISGNLKAISTSAREIEPLKFHLTETGMQRFLERIPFISTPYRRYFSRFQSRQGDVSLLIRHLNRLMETIEKESDLLENQKMTLKDQCTALIKAVYMGNLINRKLDSALEKDVLDDDPRRGFIESEILPRLKTRLRNLGFQRELNKACLEAVLIVLDNIRELKKGLEMVKDALVSSYNLGRKTSRAMTGKEISGLIMDDGQEEESDVDGPLPGFQALSDALLRIPFLCQTILDFINRAEPIITDALADIPRLQKKTDQEFMKASMAYDDITKV